MPTRTELDDSISLRAGVERSVQNLWSDRPFPLDHSLITCAPEPVVWDACRWARRSVRSTDRRISRHERSEWAVACAS